tara:strand:+ start:566 stop:715 length:150 start_codon:yes stop_codon:yes gene_type:complete
MKKEIRNDEYIYYEFEDIETNEIVLCKIPVMIFTNEENSLKASDRKKFD